MTNDQFLTTFQHHLNVSGPQREEIIAEMESHLKEQPPEKLGDPKELARKSNRVHLGIFFSFQELVKFRLISFLLFEIVGIFLINRWGLNRWSFSTRPISEMLLLASSITPILFTVTGAHAIGNMNHRWVLLLKWSGVMTICAFISLLYTQTYASVSFPSEMNIPWWYTTQILESFLVTLLLSLAVITAGSGRRAWLPQHPWIDVVFAFLLQGIGSLLLIGYLINATHTLATPLPVVFEGMISWIENNPFTYAITIGLLGGIIEAVRIYYFGKQHKKT